MTHLPNWRWRALRPVILHDRYWSSLWSCLLLLPGRETALTHIHTQTHTYARDCSGCPRLTRFSVIHARAHGYWNVRENIDCYCEGWCRNSWGRQFLKGCFNKGFVFYDDRSTVALDTIAYKVISTIKNFHSFWHVTYISLDEYDLIVELEIQQGSKGWRKRIYSGKDV